MGTQPPPTKISLLKDATANVNGEPKEWNGVGVGSIHVYGTFDTCNVAIEASTDGGETWTAYATSYTAAIITTFEAGNILVRAVLSSVGSSTSVSVDLIPAIR